MATILLVDGTYGRRGGGLRPGSPLADALVARGHRLAAGGDPESWTENWTWTTSLDGILGRNDIWEEASRSLYLWLKLKQPRPTPVDVILSWSHGGQVVAGALARGVRVPQWMPIAMPVRADLAAIYRAARVHAGRIVQIRSDRTDIWQWAGTLFDGSWRSTRDLPIADQVIVEPGTSHAGLLAPELWDARGWWSWFPGSRDTAPRVMPPS